MGKITEQYIEEFHRGMTNDVYTKDTRFARVIAHCDPLSTKAKLSPFREMKTDSTTDTEKLCRYLVAASQSLATTNEYALGVTDGSNLRPKLYKRQGASDTWAAVTGGAASSGAARSEGAFVAYRDFIYGWSGTDGSSGGIWAHNIASQSFNESALSNATVNAATSAVQGLVHSKDAILYMPYNTANGGKIALKNGGTSETDNWTSAGITVAKDQLITSIFEYGDYLGIACKPRYAGPGNNSVVYLWDRDTSLATLSQKIDFGSETLLFAEELDGYIIGISKLATATGTDGVDFVGWAFNSKVVFKYATAGMTGATELLQIPAESTSNTILMAGQQKANHRLYFMMSIKLNGTQIDGVWAFGRNQDGQYALYVDRLLNNGTAISECTPKGFILFGDYMFVAYTTDYTSPTYVAKVTQTSSAVYSASSTYESVIITPGRNDFKLLAIATETEPMPSDGEITISYKKEGETDWTVIFIHSEEDSIYHEAINIESSGDNLPLFGELQLQVISTGNVVFTGIYLKYEEIENNPS